MGGVSRTDGARVLSPAQTCLEALEGSSSAPRVYAEEDAQPLKLDGGLKHERRAHPLLSCASARPGSSSPRHARRPIRRIDGGRHAPRNRLRNDFGWSRSMTIAWVSVCVSISKPSRSFVFRNASRASFLAPVGSVAAAITSFLTGRALPRSALASSNVPCETESLVVKPLEFRELDSAQRRPAAKER